MNKRLSLDDIANASDTPITEVEIPEWGGSVGIRVITGKEREDFEDYCIKMGGGQKLAQNPNAAFSIKGIRARLLRLTLVGADGQALCPTDSDAARLMDKSSVVIDRLFDEVRVLNGLDKKAVERAEGN